MRRAAGRRCVRHFHLSCSPRGTRMPQRSTIVWPEGPVKATSRRSHDAYRRLTFIDCQPNLCITYIYIYKITRHICVCARARACTYVRTNVDSRCFRLPRTIRICRSRLARSRPSDVRLLSMLVLSRRNDATRIYYVLRTKLPGLTGYTRFFRSRQQFLCCVRYFCPSVPFFIFLSS